MVNIKARRKLSALYERGVEVRFGLDSDGRPFGRIASKDNEDPDKGIFVSKGRFVDADGKPVPPTEDEVQVWLQTPNPLQRDMAMRDAQASRAKSLVRTKREEGSEEHLTVLAFLADMTDETLIEYVLLQDNDERRQEALREVLGEDEWKDMTAYQDGLREYEERGLTQEELLADEDYQALLDVDIKFGAQVAEIENALMDAHRSALVFQLETNRAVVEKKAISRRADLVSMQAYMAEYERQMLFYSIRDFDEPASLFFESAYEMAGQDEDVLRLFQAALAPFISDSAEAKNLQGVVSGLGSSEPPSEPETSEASTPETATV